MFGFFLNLQTYKIYKCVNKAFKLVKKLKEEIIVDNITFSSKFVWEVENDFKTPS